jgi:hypothetical protein
MTIERHGHVVPLPEGFLARCGGPALCKVCQVELAHLGVELTEYLAAKKTGLARVLSALLRVCRRDYSEADKSAVLKEILHGGGTAQP